MHNNKNMGYFVHLRWTWTHPQSLDYWWFSMASIDFPSPFWCSLLSCRKGIWSIKNLCHSFPRGSVWERVRRKTRWNHLTQVHLENAVNNLTQRWWCWWFVQKSLRQWLRGFFLPQACAWLAERRFEAAEKGVIQTIPSLVIKSDLHRPNTNEMQSD